MGAQGGSKNKSGSHKGHHFRFWRDVGVPRECLGKAPHLFVNLRKLGQMSTFCESGHRLLLNKHDTMYHTQRHKSRVNDIKYFPNWQIYAFQHIQVSVLACNNPLLWRYQQNIAKAGADVNNCGSGANSTLNKTLRDTHKGINLNMCILWQTGCVTKSWSVFIAQKWLVLWDIHCWRLRLSS